MKPRLLAFLSLVVLVPTTRAHFVWIVPDSKSGTVQVVFSETPAPDDPKLLPKIAGTKMLVHVAGNKPESVSMTQKDAAFVVTVPGKGPRTVTGFCCYGVVERKDSEPFLLSYAAKAQLTDAGLGGVKQVPATPCKLTLEIVAAAKDAGKFVVLFKDKPLADAEIVVAGPTADAAANLKTDAAGSFTFNPTGSGIYGVRVRHVEKREGQHDGKKYKEVRHFTTLVVRGSAAAAADKEPLKPDPAASKLLADARAARALWKNFPGFSADVEVNLDGKVSKGRVEVESGGKAHYVDLSKEAETWVKPILGSIVGHRLDSTPRDTPCAFGDDVTTHPMGRLIHVLNDEMHSGYRIRDNQILVVDRNVEGQKFTISVLENRANPEGKYLPISFSVDYWNPASGELLRADATFQSWKRVGTFDLPVVARIVSARKVGVTPADPATPWKNVPSTKSLTLSNHKLLEVK